MVALYVSLQKSKRFSDALAVFELGQFARLGDVDFNLIEVREFRRIRIERMALPKQVLVAASFSFWDFASGH
jgi:hypothetical protein